MTDKVKDQPKKKRNVAPYHSYDVNKTLDTLRVDLTNGLSLDEAHERLLKYGPNELEKEEPESLWIKSRKQFEDILVRLLLLAAIVSFVVSQFGIANHRY